MNKLLIATLLVTCSVSFSQNGNSIWKSSSIKNDSKEIKKTNLPLKHLFDLDVNTLKNELASSPKRGTTTSSNTIVSLPDGEGNLENFIVYENSVLDPELAAKYPEIKSYIAIGIDNPRARAYFSNSPLGFKSMTLYPDQSAVFIEPVTSDLNTYTIYKKSDNETSSSLFECGTIDELVLNSSQRKKSISMLARGADDAKLRTFRLALSCTAEYAQFFGGTKALALAGMSNTLTRINGVFERDFGVKLILIANNDIITYTAPLTDPYSDSTIKSNWRSELKSTLNTVIGLANYDIGHLLGANSINVSSGDAGCIGCVCSDFNKGAGYTCANPINFSGDRFDIDFVAHEMGHQLGANHTYSYVTESSSGAQMEPGSGSTIMSYAGSTSKDVQNFSDAYFHAISIQQVTDNIKTKTCAVAISTGNAVPAVNAGLDYSIPKGTPFLLTGSATDANTDDVLTYAWEEMDLGNATTTVPSITAITGPLFRSYPPTTSAIRYFPNMTTVLAGSVTTSSTEIPTEVLAGVARTLNFRLTVRDNRANGSANNTDDMTITVDGNSGPFSVDSQNSAVSYKSGSTQTINWTVAGTNANGVNCATVDILLSTDGGKSFPITLLSGTSNNGSAIVAIPNIAGTTNRIMVKGTNQIFFDVNNTNFTITTGSATADTTAPTASTLSVSGTTASGTNLSWTAATDNVGITGYDVYQNGILKTTTSATSLAVSGLSSSTGYNFYVVAKDPSGNMSAASNTVNLTTLYSDTIAPTASTLSASGITSSSINLSWTAATDNLGVTGYNVYQNNSLISTTTANSLTVSNLSASTAYSFYVVAKDAAGNVSVASNTINASTVSTIDTIAPTAAILSNSGTTTSSTNLSWTAATDNVGVIGYNIYQNNSLISTTTTNLLTLSNLSPSTSYSFYIVAKDAAGNLSTASNTVSTMTLSDSGATTLSGTMLAYCPSNGTSTAKEYINKVQIGAINTASGNNNGYANFSLISTDLAIGSSNAIVITPAWNGSALYEAYAVWIDFNQDGDFNDNGELVCSKPKTRAKSVSGYLNIPTTALTGTTRMRISMKNTMLPSPCEIFPYGEVEDYTVNITGSTAKPDTVTNESIALSVTDNKLEDTKVSFKLYPNPVQGDVLNISNLKESSDFRIFNLMGQELVRNHIENDAVYVGNLDAGVYLIEVKDGFSTTTKPFIKQ